MTSAALGTCDMLLLNTTLVVKNYFKTVFFMNEQVGTIYSQILFGIITV